MTATTERSTGIIDSGWAPDERPSDTARGRLVVSAASLAALATGLAGLLFGSGDLRAFGLLGYLLFGLGAAPWALSRRMGLALRLALSAAGSLTVLILASTVMLLGDLWHPTVLAVAAVASTAVLHVAGVLAARRDWPARGGTPRPAGRPAILLAAGGAALCAVAALTHRHLDPGLWGFLARIGPLWYLGLILVLMSLAVARSADERAVAVGVVLLMLVLTGTPALVYDGPRSQSAAKHLEFVQQIRDFHYLRTTVGAYNGWPGFFAAIAWVADAAGLKDPIGLATAWPVVMGLGRVAAMRYLAGQLIGGRTLPWVAVGLGVLADPIGADYFSPQAVGFVLGLTIFGLALSTTLRPGLRITAMTAAGTAAAVAHQLSPYVIGGTLCVLVLFRRVRPWWTPATVLGPAIAWTALHWAAVDHFFSLADIGNAANFRPPATAVTPGLHRLPVVSATVAALVGGVVLLGLVALVTLLRSRRDRHTWAVALSPAVGLAIVAINPYGNEGIFRAVLFALPWLAVLAARALRRNDAHPIHWRLAALLLALGVTFTVAAFGLDATNVLRQPDRAAMRIFLSGGTTSAGTNYLLDLGPGDLPSSPPTLDPPHVAVKRSDIDRDGFSLAGLSAPAAERRITDEFVAYAARSKGARLYAMWSPVSSYYGSEYGIHTRAQFAALRDAFAVSASWRTVYAEGGTVLFAYRPAGS